MNGGERMADLSVACWYCKREGKIVKIVGEGHARARTHIGEKLECIIELECGHRHNMLMAKSEAQDIPGYSDYFDQNPPAK